MDSLEGQLEGKPVFESGWSLKACNFYKLGTFLLHSYEPFGVEPDLIPRPI